MDNECEVFLQKVVLLPLKDIAAMLLLKTLIHTLKMCTAEIMIKQIRVASTSNTFQNSLDNPLEVIESL